jgi:hypothetical protein
MYIIAISLAIGVIQELLNNNLPSTQLPQHSKSIPSNLEADLDAVPSNTRSINGIPIE